MRILRSQKISISNILFPLFLASLIISCASSKSLEPEIVMPEPEPPRVVFEAPKVYQPGNKELTLVFAGDIMAHEPNYQMKDYNKIWEGIRDITLDSDFTFANIEAPVDNELPLSSYPSFNMHENYVQAAIDAGFNVFSLANNHTNDQYLKGIQATEKYAKRTEDHSKKADRKIYFSGLKDGKKAEFSYHLIEEKGWKILYVAVTQLLNRPDYADYVNYVPSKKDDKAAFVKWIKKIKAENPCDFFILSLHTNEEEYIREVTKKQRSWYTELMNSGVDILWANHAHLIKHQEIIKTERNSRYPTKLLMCANGNTISGQRTKPNLKESFTERDDTGDGLLYKVTLRKTPDSKEAFIFKTERFFITTYINTAGEFILKKLDDEFIDYLKENRESWVEYIKKRRTICESIKD
ncbi:MAG: CapA family protein [Treponema sp.]|nr:CapA family protein [Treponema sp.]